MIDRKRLELEKQLMNESYPEFKFYSGRKNKLQLIGWHGGVKVNSKNYRIGIFLSSTYPNTRPYVFILDNDYNFKDLNTSHQDEYKNLCLYTSDGTENSWHKDFSIVDVIERFKGFINLYQKGKHKDIHQSIIDPLIDLTDETKYVMDFDWKPSDNGENGYVEFQRQSENDNFYYAINIQNKSKDKIEYKKNNYMETSDNLAIETIKWIYLKREKMDTILKLKRYSDFKYFFAKKGSIKFFFENDLTKCIIFTGRDKKRILINISSKLSFSNIIEIEKSSFFARNKGIVDVDVLENKTVAIFGLGSLGSKIAELLTRSGVGKFIFFDYDQFTPENLSRHILTMEDLFLNKSEAMKKRLKKINPWVEVDSIATSQNILYYDHLYEVMIRLLKRADIIISATGNEESEHNINYILNDLSREQIVPALFTAILGNGFGGRIHRIEIGKTPCYQCIKIQQEKDPVLYKLYTEETFKNTNEYEYGIYSEAGIPGLDVDINIVASLTVKMILDKLLAKENDTFKFNSYIWGNKVGWIFDEPFQLKDIRFSKISNCPICGGKE